MYYDGSSRFPPSKVVPVLLNPLGGIAVGRRTESVGGIYNTVIEGPNCSVPIRIYERHDANIEGCGGTGPSSRWIGENVGTYDLARGTLLVYDSDRIRGDRSMVGA